MCVVCVVCVCVCVCVCVSVGWDMRYGAIQILKPENLCVCVCVCLSVGGPRVGPLAAHTDPCTLGFDSPGWLPAGSRLAGGPA